MNSQERGASLTEVMIGVALIGVVSLVVIAVSGLINDLSRYDKRQSALQSLSTAISETLNVNSSCLAAFNSGNGTTVDYNLAQTAAGQPVALLVPSVASQGGGNPYITGNPTVNAAYGNFAGSSNVMDFWGYSVEELDIANARLVDDVSPADNISDDGQPDYIATVEMRLKRIGSGLGSMDQKKIVVATIIINTDGTNKIIGCHGVGAVSDLAQMCRNLGCTPDTTVTPTTCNCQQETRLCGVGQALYKVEKGQATCPPFAKVCPNATDVLTSVLPGACSQVGVAVATPTPGPTAPTPCPAGTYRGDLGLPALVCKVAGCRMTRLCARGYTCIPNYCDGAICPTDKDPNYAMCVTHSDCTGPATPVPAPPCP